MIERLPESWVAPDHVLDLRARVRLRHTLADQRGEWQQRIQAVLYHHGVPQRRRLMTREVAPGLRRSSCRRSAREQITVALVMIDALDAQLAPLTGELRAYARRQPGCRALMAHYGIGALTAVTILAELGDARRFSSSRHAVRYSGLDITVHQSDQRRAPGHLSRQGPPALRWALFEAAQVARRPGSPDRDYYTQTAERLDTASPGLCSHFGSARGVRERCRTAMVRKGSPVRVRQRASETALQRGFLVFGVGLGDHFRSWEGVDGPSSASVLLEPAANMRHVSQWRAIRTISFRVRPGTQWAPLRRGFRPLAP